MLSKQAELAMAELPDTFRFSEGLDRISERQLRNLLAHGRITALARGLYRKSDWSGDDDLIEIAAKSPRATLCLRTALARHDLIDDIPAAIDLAIPRGAWAPSITIAVHWHHFAASSFDIGRDSLEIEGGHELGIYNQERCLIDMFRLRHLEGSDLANEALRRWLATAGSRPRS